MSQSTSSAHDYSSHCRFVVLDCDHNCCLTIEKAHLTHHLGIDRGKGTAVPLCVMVLGMLYEINEAARFEQNQEVRFLGFL